MIPTGNGGRASVYSASIGRGGDGDCCDRAGPCRGWVCGRRARAPDGRGQRFCPHAGGACGRERGDGEFRCRRVCPDSGGLRAGERQRLESQRTRRQGGCHGPADGLEREPVRQPERCQRDSVDDDARRTGERERLHRPRLASAGLHWHRPASAKHRRTYLDRCREPADAVHGVAVPGTWKRAWIPGRGAIRRELRATGVGIRPGRPRYELRAEVSERHRGQVDHHAWQSPGDGSGTSVDGRGRWATGFPSGAHFVAGHAFRAWPGRRATGRCAADRTVRAASASRAGRRSGRGACRPGFVRTDLRSTRNGFPVDSDGGEPAPAALARSSTAASDPPPPGTPRLAASRRP